MVKALKINLDFLWQCFFIAMLSLVYSCSSGTTGKKKPKIKSVIPEPIGATASEIVREPEALTENKLIRRISIDLKGKLPDPADITAISNKEKLLTGLIDEYTATNEFAEAISRMHWQIWGFNHKSTYDLNLFAEEDASLDTALTTAVKESIMEEPIMVLRKTIQDKKSYKAIFTGTSTIMHSSALSLFNHSSSTTIWANESYKSYSYTDNRPSMGILSGYGFHSSTDGQGNGSQEASTAEIFKSLSCRNYYDANAHLYRDLTADEIQSDLKTVAITNTKCAVCHNTLNNTSKDFSGFKDGTTLANWQVYNAVSTGTRYYEGHAYGSSSGLANFIANDPRTVLCEITSIYEQMLQRPLNFKHYDRSRISELFSLFKKSDYKFPSLLKFITLSSTYQSSLLTQKTKKSISKYHSGARYLNAHQLRSIMKQISPTTASIFISNNLSPGSDDTSNSKLDIPSGSYIHQVNQYIQNAVTAIIDDELATNKEASTRYLLSLLPDGSGNTDVTTLIDQQIISAWYKLTSNLLDSNSTQFTNIKALWTIGYASATGNDEKTRKAWQLTLIGMMLSPEFLSY